MKLIPKSVVRPMLEWAYAIVRSHLQLCLQTSSTHSSVMSGWLQWEDRCDRIRLVSDMGAPYIRERHMPCQWRNKIKYIPGITISVPGITFQNLSPKRCHLHFNSSLHSRAQMHGKSLQAQNMRNELDCTQFPQKLYIACSRSLLLISSPLPGNAAYQQFVPL
jgi:hypothetical protein